MNNYYLAFDDTDNLETVGTGHLLEQFLESLDGQWDFISRHQLFVNKEVPYTSHNSAMCALVTTALASDELIALAADFLRAHAAEGSDPGLCVAAFDQIKQSEQLVFWGYRAKKEVLQKADAYALAKTAGVHLSEHGGTGQGVVGALAAVGLRLAGQDGRIKGKQFVDEDVLTVRVLLEKTGFDAVSAYGQGCLPEDARVIISGKPIKAVYQNFCRTILVVPDEEHYRLLDKDQLKCF